MAKTPDPLEVLAFIHGHSAITSGQWKARFPDWHDRIPAALARYRQETEHGRRGWARSDVMVNCEADAIHRWVFLPLIRAALEAGSRP